MMFGELIVLAMTCGGRSHGGTRTTSTAGRREPEARQPAALLVLPSTGPHGVFPNQPAPRIGKQAGPEDIVPQQCRKENVKQKSLRAIPVDNPHACIPWLVQFWVFTTEDTEHTERGK